MVTFKMTPKINIKQKDDFYLTLFVQNTNSIAAIESKKSVVFNKTVYENLLKVPNPDLEIINQKLELYVTSLEAYKAITKVDITNWNISASLAWGIKFIEQFSVQIINPLSGHFAISLTSLQTANLKPRPYSADIRLVSDSFGTISSQTFCFKVIQEIPNG